MTALHAYFLRGVIIGLALPAGAQAEITLLANLGTKAVDIREFQTETLLQESPSGLPTTSTRSLRTHLHKGFLSSHGLGIRWQSQQIFLQTGFSTAAGQVNHKGHEPYFSAHQGDSYLYFWRSYTQLGKQFSEWPLKPSIAFEILGELRESHITEPSAPYGRIREDNTTWGTGLTLDLTVFSADHWNIRSHATYRTLLSPSQRTNQHPVKLTTDGGSQFSAVFLSRYFFGKGYFVEPAVAFTQIQMNSSRNHYEGNKNTPLRYPETKHWEADLYIAIGKQF